MTTRPPPGDKRARGESEADVDVGEPVEREGHETLLPPAARSVLGAKSYVAGEVTTERVPQVDSEMIIDVRQRAARTGDVIGGRYIVEGQLGRGGMGRVLRVRHQALGKQFALKLIKNT